METWLLLQPWLNTLGLLLDFIGVLLLVREWRIAADHDANEAELADWEERLRPNPMMPRPQGPHADMHADMRQRHAFHQRQGRIRATWAARRTWFMAAFLVIGTGYLLQLVASVPVGGIAP
ncbi:MAG: hypothetical protein AAGA48_30815 [Myxococcota bacterium]